MLNAVRRTLAKIRRDAERYFALEARTAFPRRTEKLKILFTSGPFLAVVAYRISHLIRIELGPAPGPVLSIFSAVVEQASQFLWGIHIDPGAEIGPGLYLGHPGGVWIGPVRMGADCNVTHNTTIGRRTDGKPGTPTLGDRVWIGTGSVIFGPITVGDGVTVGPLTLVGRDVPPRCLVLGNPMRMVFRDYDNTIQIGFTPAAAPPEIRDSGPRATVPVAAAPEIRDSGLRATVPVVAPAEIPDSRARATKPAVGSPKIPDSGAPVQISQIPIDYAPTETTSAPTPVIVEASSASGGGSAR